MNWKLVKKPMRKTPRKPKPHTTIKLKLRAARKMADLQRAKKIAEPIWKVVGKAEPVGVWPGGFVAKDQPGRGEIIGSQVGPEGKSPIHRITDDRIEQVLKCAKDKDDSSVGIILRAIAIEGMREGREEVSKHVIERINAVHRLHRDELVRSFLAHIKSMERGDGRIPMVLRLGRPTLNAIVSALSDAGWGENRTPDVPGQGQG